MATAASVLATGSTTGAGLPMGFISTMKIKKNETGRTTCVMSTYRMW